MPDATHADSSSATGLPDGYLPRPYGIDFSLAVAPGGYLWWYVDAISDDGEQAMTLIVFVGSVFSPYYAAARRRGDAPAENHCAFNAILYGPGRRKRWSMTERSSRRLQRSERALQIGPSALHWDGEQLVAEIDERCTPWPAALRGRISVQPAPLSTHSLQLDAAGRHRWHPLAPIARVRIAMREPQVHWEGAGYLDSNAGDEPLEQGFRDWDWSRAALPGGDCAVLYHTRDRAGSDRRLAMRFDAAGTLRCSEPPPLQPLPATPLWRIPRSTLAAADSAAQVLRTLEDTPFYARSLLRTACDGEALTAVHESLSLSRFERRWVQTLLPFRMPRWG